MTAVISDCGRYRYRLERSGFGGVGVVSWIMVNPSTADATADDATIRKVIGFTERLGGGRAVVGNLFAWRATDIKALRPLDGPTAKGPENDTHLSAIMQEGTIIIAAWGPLGKLPPQLRGRWRTVNALAERLQIPLHCLGTAKDGQPRHPLMVAYDTPLAFWKAPL